MSNKQTKLSIKPQTCVSCDIWLQCKSVQNISLSEVIFDWSKVNFSMTP